MTVSSILEWREGVAIQADETESLRIEGPETRFVLHGLHPAVRTALLRLAPPGHSEQELADLVLDSGGPGALATLYYHLQRFDRRRLLTHAVAIDGRRLATLVPTVRLPASQTERVDPESQYFLSRFAYLRRVGNAMVLESPRAHARIILGDARAISLLGSLAVPATVRELAEQATSLATSAILPLLDMLARAGMLERPDSGHEHESPSLRCWEFHDLLFHARSRKGRSDAPFGATYRMVGQLEPPPALKPPGSGDLYVLDRPDLDRLEREDPPLARVVEQRCSLREYADRPITARQLGEFLYRVARVRHEREESLETPQGTVRMTFVSRPYPSGGALYELEFYVAVNVCDGIPAGLYHYDARDHRLWRVAERTDEVERLLRDAAASAAISEGDVQVLLILSARFARVAWKYVSIAYALILKHVGVVYQTMYLAATAMNLAPCALGGGDSDLFACAAGTEYEAETSVGEFLLGSRR